MLNKLLGKQVDPQEQARQWKLKLRGEERALDRQVRAIQLEEQKVTRSLKEAAKKNDQQVVRIFAKELVRSRKAKARIHTTKAQIRSIGLQLEQTQMQAKVMGAIQKNAEIMAVMNQLVNVQEVRETMMALSKEMMKAGLIDEMVAETMESLDDEDVEEAADAEVAKVIDEVLGSRLTGASVGAGRLPQQVAVPPPEEEEDDLEARFNQLKQSH
jgi:charged multivesicular body protein 3